MDQIEKLQTQIEAMRAELAESAKAQHRTAVEAELGRQAPTAPEIVRRLALAELSSTDEVADFLASESVKPLLAEQAAEQAAEQPKSERPSLEQMLGDVRTGNAQFKIG